MSAEIGFGSSIAYSDTENGSYTAISEVVDVMGPPVTVTRVDSSHHGMSNPFVEKLAGLGDAVEVDVVIHFTSSQAATLYALLRSNKWWRIRAPLVGAETTPATWKCAGFLGDFQHLTPLNDRMTIALKIVLSGKPTFTAGS